MNKEIINDLTIIVKTLSNEEIKDYIQKHCDILQTDTHLELISNLDNDNLQKEFLELMNNETIFNILQDWKKSCPQRHLEFIIDDCLSTILMTIEKIKNKKLQQEYLKKVMDEIVPFLSGFIGNDLFVFFCEDNYVHHIKELIKDWNDEEKISFIKKLDYFSYDYITIYQDEDKLELLKDHFRKFYSKDRIAIFETLENDFIKTGLLENAHVSNYSHINIISSLKDRKLLKFYIKFYAERINSYLTENCSDFEEFQQSITAFVKMLDQIGEDHLTEQYIHKYKNFIGNDFLGYLIAIIKDDSKKEKLIRNYHDELKEDSQNLTNVIKTIKDKKIYLNTYKYYETELNFSNKLELAICQKDLHLAKKLIFRQYDQLNNTFLVHQKRVEVISNLIALFQILNSEEQLKIFHTIRMVLEDKEDIVLLATLKDKEIKRDYIKKIREKQKIKQVANIYTSHIIH